MWSHPLSKRSVKFIEIIVQLFLILLVIRAFEIEGVAFFRMAVLGVVGFVVHALIAVRYRLPFFLGLSLCAMVVVFGVISSLWLLMIGLFLIGFLFLPLRFRTHILLLTLLGLGLALVRAKAGALLASAEWSRHLLKILPIAGSIFMFRMVLFLYDREHDRKRYDEPKATVFLRTLSYFFLLPNFCFPLFPLVSYEGFKRTYFNDDALVIYQTGVRRIFFGLLQILAGRVVYQYMAIDPSEVVTSLGLFRYLTADYLFYMKTTGQFDLCIGMLCLFGFNLPKPTNFYFLAANFLETWRRGNIYWKDAMLRLVYNPVYFQFRHFGKAKALVIATLVVFLTTFVLHFYQWFWIRGDVSITLPDVLNWTVLGLLVIATSLYQSNRKPKAPRKPSQRVILQIVKTFGTMTVMSILFSMWASRSLPTWISTITFGRFVWHEMP